MYKANITTNFSAAHFLRNYKGKCESLHGHNWKVEISIVRNQLNDAGMVVDFSEMKRLTAEVLDDLDHKNLNDLDYFKQYNPSSENIAKYVFERLKRVIKEKNCQLEEVRVWETDSSCASYTDD